MDCFKKLALAASIAAVALSATADDRGFSYIPEVHGVVRARYELNTTAGDMRFQVRNARVSVGGKIAKPISYFVQTDFWDGASSKIIFLDAYGRFDICKGLFIQAGQFRMPFGIETFRAPNNYYFANRSFLGKQVMNYRAVGAKVGYTIPKTGLSLEFGAFNPTPKDNHNVWVRTVAYAGKATWKGRDGVTLSASYGSIKPSNLRANLLDGFISWENKNVLVAAEYVWKNYCNPLYKDNHSYVVFVDWHKPVKWGIFNQFSVQARFDGMTDHINMTSLKTEGKRERATIGAQLTYTYKALHADLRLNYEKYFDYKENNYSPDRLVAEMVVKF